jgi:hypothetical protein
VYLKDIRYSLFAVFLQMIASAISAPIAIRYNPNSSRTIVAAAHSTGPPMLAEVENPNRLIEKRNNGCGCILRIYKFNCVDLEQQHILGGFGFQFQSHYCLFWNPQLWC